MILKMTIHSRQNDAKLYLSAYCRTLDIFCFVVPKVCIEFITKTPGNETMVIKNKRNHDPHICMVLSSVLSKTGLAGVFPLPCLQYYPLKMADFYYTCVVPCLINKLY